MAGGASDGRVVIDTSLNNKGFIKGIRGMTGQVGGLQSAIKRLGKAITAAFAVKAVVNFGKRAVEIGSDVAEVQNVVDVAFGELTYKAEEFASSAITQFGMSTLAAKKTASTYMAMAKGMGVANNEAADMAITLAGLSGDVASFFNITQELADIKLKSVFTGETETLKDLGVVMTQDNLKAYALSKGFQKSYESMSQAEKVALRYQFVLDSLALANGDFARTQDSWANQTRILSMQWQEFMGILGQSIITVLKPVVKWLNMIVSHMIALATMLNNTVSKAFGKETGQAEATSTAIASSVENQEALTDAVEGTNKAQQKSLAGFDEINQLTGDAAGSGGEIGGGVGMDVGNLAIPDLSEMEELEGPKFSSWGEAFSAFLDTVLAGIPKLKEAFGTFASWLNEFSGKVRDMFTFSGVLEKVQQLGHDLANALNYLVEQINWCQMGQALGAGLNLALQFLVNFIYTFNWMGLGASLAEWINGAVSEIDWYDVGWLLFKGVKIGLETLAGFLLGLDMAQLAKAASQAVIGYFDAMQDTIAGIDWAQIGAQIAEFLNNVDWVGVITAISGALSELVGAGLKAIGGFISNADPETLLIAAAFLGTKLFGGLVSKVIAPLAAKIGKELISKIAGQISSGEISSLISSIGTAIGGIAKTLAGIGTIIAGVVMAATSFFSMWNEGFSWAKEAVMLLGIALTAVGAILLGAPAAVAGVIAGIVAAVATLVIVIKDNWDAIVKFFTDAWENIKEIWSAVAGWFDEHVIQPVVGFFTGLWETVTGAASAAWDGIVAVWEAVTGWFDETIIQPLTQFFTGLWERITQFASDAWDGIVAVWEAVTGWFDTNIIQPVTGFFSGMWDGIKRFASDTWDKIKGVWNTVAGWFEENVTGPLMDAFNAVGEFVKGIFNGVIGAVEGMANSVIKAINWLIKQINKISFSVPGWVPFAGGKTFGFNIPTIGEVSLPRLAAGAVIPPNREFMAVLGDQSAGNNLEAPESLIRKIVREESGGSNTELLQAILEAIRAGQVILMDGKAVTKGVVKNMNTMTRQAGRSVVLG